MGVSKGTTPTVILKFYNQPDLDLTQAKNVYVTFKSNIATITKSGDDLDITPNSISVYLKQADTLAFQLNEVEVQANWTYDGGFRACSTIENLHVDRNLLMKEVE